MQRINIYPIFHMGGNLAILLDVTSQKPRVEEEIDGAESIHVLLCDGGSQPLFHESGKPGYRVHSGYPVTEIVPKSYPQFPAGLLEACEGIAAAAARIATG